MAIYGLSSAFLLIYSLGQLHLTWNYIKRRKSETLEKPILHEFPSVTIQLPIYNEQYVAKRLIESVAKIDYPHDKLEIQILDDSDDETSQIVQDAISYLPTTLQVEHIQRPKRVGFKAGALGYGTEFAKGDLIAIFDADFIPAPNFLMETVPHFQNSEIGVVQTRWEHLNKNFSLLTHLQAFGLDAHFTVEQTGRHLSNCFISFNGTAGVWRKKCIEEAGGWESDTLTEDLDLSYRAQLKGWKFIFLENVGSPAELPVTINAFKSQQYRWNKGAAETHRKVWKKVWKAPLPFSIKFHALLQLFKGIGFVSSLLLAVFSVPLLFVRNSSTEFNFVLSLLSITLVCIVVLTSFYYASLMRFIESPRKRITYFILNFPLFLAFSFGITLHNALAVIEGYIGRKTPFIRTPKFNIAGSTGEVGSNKYTFKKIHGLTWVEGLMVGYFLMGTWMGWQYGDFTFFPFHLLIVIGYSMVFYLSIHHHFKLSKA